METIKYDLEYNYIIGIIMAEAIVVVRKWGNSVGLTIPSELVLEERLKPDDKVIVSVRKAVAVDELFGKFKTKKSGQQLKDEMRAGWE